MSVSIKRMSYAAQTCAKLWVGNEIKVSEARNLVRPLYRENAVLISPFPPQVSSNFGTTLNGRDEIMKYFEVRMELNPAGCVSTKHFLFGINLVIWVYEPFRQSIVMADVFMFDEDGLIETQCVTSAGLGL